MEIQESKNLALSSGFTLIEILIAVAIVAMLAGGAVPYFMGKFNEAKYKTAQGDMQVFKTAITIFKTNLGRYPGALKELIKAPSGDEEKKRWKAAHGPFLGTEDDPVTEIKNDPWENPYKYKLTPGAQHPYELYSYGKNGPEASKDEYISVWDKISTAL